MSNLRAPPGKAYFCRGPDETPELIDFPSLPEVGWHYRGHEITMIDFRDGSFRTSAGDFKFSDWQQWGAEGCQ